jgi:type VI secretion system VasD/TssJ family lipoprotein
MARSRPRVQLGCFLFLVACGHQQPPQPCKGEPLRLSIEAAPQVNLDEKGHSLPTTLRIYQLKDTAKLDGATFDDMLDHDKDTIGPDLVAVQEVVINPGERIEPPLQRQADADFVGVVALFRTPAGIFWRLSRPLPAADPDHCREAAKNQASLRFHLEENRVENR